MKQSLGFFARFAVVAAVAFWAWGLVSAGYLASLVPAVNGLFGLAHLPVRLGLRGEALVYAYGRADGGVLQLQALGHESIVLNMVAGLSLLAASPTLGFRRMTAWMAAAAALLWLTHVLTFFAAGQVALWEYAGHLAPSLRAPLASEFALSLPYDRSRLLLRILEQWNVWARYALCLGLWFRAMASAAAPVAVRQQARARQRVSWVGAQAVARHT
ncbi:MAG: hypothetical protein ABIL09_16615 [Gemmatimonadota bacterium]